MKPIPSGHTAVMASRVDPLDALDFYPTPPWATRALCEHVLIESDWHGRSVWEPEALTGSDVPSTCSAFPGATGGVVKVRAWNDEHRPDRHPSIGCARLEGRYLLRLRLTAAGLRICHESWSMAEGICTSCPTAPACARH